MDGYTIWPRVLKNEVKCCLVMLVYCPSNYYVNNGQNQILQQTLTVQVIYTHYYPRFRLNVLKIITAIFPKFTCLLPRLKVTEILVRVWYPTHCIRDCHFKMLYIFMQNLMFHSVYTVHYIHVCLTFRVPVIIGLKTLHIWITQHLVLSLFIVVHVLAIIFVTILGGFLSQEAYLLDKLQMHANTEYGKKFKFSDMRSRSDFVRLHPLTDFSHYKVNLITFFQFLVPGWHKWVLSCFFLVILFKCLLILQRKLQVMFSVHGCNRGITVFGCTTIESILQFCLYTVVYF